MPRTLVLLLALAAASSPAAAAGSPPHGCSPTVPPRKAARDPRPSAAGFNYGGGQLRVHLSWPSGMLRAGMLPDGGAIATVDAERRIHLKLGWWRGVPGRLTVSGRRLDGPAAALRVDVPSGYGSRGFQPSGLVFPRTGCWEVVGAVGRVRLRFVVRVTLLDPS